jgi:hypothetical protein
LEICVKTLGEGLVFGAVRNEYAVKLQRGACKRAHVSDEVLGNTCTAQKGFGDLALAAVDRVDANHRRERVAQAVEPLHGAQVNVPEDRESN